MFAGVTTHAEMRSRIEKEIIAARLRIIGDAEPRPVKSQALDEQARQEGIDPSRAALLSPNPRQLV